MKEVMLLEIGLKSLVDEFATIIKTKNFYLGRENLNHGVKTSPLVFI
jgi:hypothetical protein